MTTRAELLEEARQRFFDGDLSRFSTFSRFDEWARDEHAIGYLGLDGNYHWLIYNDSTLFLGQNSTINRYAIIESMPMFVGRGPAIDTERLALDQFIPKYTQVHWEARWGLDEKMQIATPYFWQDSQAVYDIDRFACPDSEKNWSTTDALWLQMQCTDTTIIKAPSSNKLNDKSLKTRLIFNSTTQYNAHPEHPEYRRLMDLAIDPLSGIIYSVADVVHEYVNKVPRKEPNLPWSHYQKKFGYPGLFQINSNNGQALEIYELNPDAIPSKLDLLRYPWGQAIFCAGNEIGKLYFLKTGVFTGVAGDIFDVTDGITGTQRPGIDNFSEFGNYRQIAEVVDFAVSTKIGVPLYTVYSDIFEENDYFKNTKIRETLPIMSILWDKFNNRMLLLSHRMRVLNPQYGVRKDIRYSVIYELEPFPVDFDFPVGFSPTLKARARRLKEIWRSKEIEEVEPKFVDGEWQHQFRYLIQHITLAAESGKLYALGGEYYRDIYFWGSPLPLQQGYNKNRDYTPHLFTINLDIGDGSELDHRSITSRGYIGSIAYDPLKNKLFATIPNNGEFVEIDLSNVTFAEPSQPQQPDTVVKRGTLEFHVLGPGAQYDIAFTRLNKIDDRFDFYDFLVLTLTSTRAGEILRLEIGDATSFGGRSLFPVAARHGYPYNTGTKGEAQVFNLNITAPNVPQDFYVPIAGSQFADPLTRFMRHIAIRVIDASVPFRFSLTRLQMTKSNLSPRSSLSPTEDVMTDFGLVAKFTEDDVRRIAKFVQYRAILMTSVPPISPRVNFGIEHQINPVDVVNPPVGRLRGGRRRIPHILDSALGFGNEGFTTTPLQVQVGHIQDGFGVQPQLQPVPPAEPEPEPEPPCNDATLTLYDTLDSLFAISFRRLSTSRYRFAQEFSGVQKIYAVNILLNKIGSPVGDVIVNLKSDSGGTPGAFIQEIARVDTSILPTHPSVLVIPFIPATTITGLNPALTYWIEINSDVPLSNSDYLNVITDSGSTVIDGDLYVDTNDDEIFQSLGSFNSAMEIEACVP